ncbi:MAG TPA: ABC transporter substrate-binding protein [Anaerolineae bacterium]|nr:ABC transporter substrate-binding protein [Anaerolineae bacterium]HQI87508.1 ABC transporter substrate-binding protein [Anaerolineae bacterium]
MIRRVVMLSLAAVVLAACSAAATPTTLPATTPAPPATPTVAATKTAVPTWTPTPEPTPYPQELVLCATEPAYASPFIPSQAGDDLLALFYEEPVERVGYRWEARLIERVPSLEAGDVFTQAVPVPNGALYVDEVGAVLTNASEDVLLLPQLVVTFTLQKELYWSDGEPLTADDVILGYYLAQAPEAQGRWRQLVERTARLVAVNPRTVRWEGIPGYLSADYPGFLFPPQPAHRWKDKSLAQILEDRTPPATGPFRIVAWEAGREVRLEPNPYYSGTPPTLKKITFRFPKLNLNSWGQLLLSGQCDILLPDPVMTTDWQSWLDMLGQGQAMIWANVSPVVLRLDFNVQPINNTPTPLTDARVRHGLAQCIDRTALSEAAAGQAFVPASGFIPPGHPAYNPAALLQTTYNPDMGRSLLDEAGWRDEDGDGLREAHDVIGFKNGTPLSLTLHLAPQYFVTAAYVAANLEACGVGVLPQPTEPQLLYANDAVSPLLGRTYQMALFGWRAELPELCGGWLSDRIPTAETRWTGENFSGYVSEVYDAACRHALTTIDIAEQDAALQKADALLSADLPTVFLTWRPFWFVARPYVRGLKPDDTAYGTLWNSEEIYIAAEE